MADLFQTNPEAVEALLLDIGAGRLALPEFQRDFIWEPENTARLLSSLMARYPAGSLLTWRPKTVELEPRAFADAPSLPANSDPDRLVLDGQQRLTALYRALEAKTEESYFLAVDQFIDADTFELRDGTEINWDLAVIARELTAGERRGLKKNSPIEPEHRDIKWQHANFRFPLGTVFDDWMDGLVDGGITEEEKRARRSVLRHIRDEYLAQLKNYRFPVITLTDEASLAAVCSVFEKLNSNSVKLGPFEILTAKFFRDGVRLRKLWEDARSEYSVLRDPGSDNDHSGFSVDPYAILQIITLIVHRSPQQRAVLEKLTASNVEEHWAAVVLALKRVIEHLRDSCGVIHRDLLPYQAILVPLTGAWLTRDKMTGPKKAEALTKLSRYFWASVFTTNFDQGGASQAERDYRDLVAWLRDEEDDEEQPILPEAIGELSITSDSLLSATVKKKALLKGLMALTVQAGAKDFHKGEKLTPQLYVEDKVNSHHLYPKARLADKSDNGIDPAGYSPELILNRTLIDATTNRRIGARKPSVYVDDIRVETDVDALLESHLINTKALESDNYASFLAMRLDDVVARLVEVTGLTVESLQNPEADAADDQPAASKG